MSLLNISPELLELGMSSSVLVARGVDNTKISPELIAYRRHAGQRLGAFWKNRHVSQHPAIAEYQRHHELYGVTGEVSAPEKLLTYVRRNKDFTSSGAVVDCYNIVSARTLLSMGAHDLGKFKQPVTLRVCTADDHYIPLGETEPQSVAGEYGYVDADGQVICRLDVKQCEATKTTRESTDIAFFLQANAHLSAATLLRGTWLLAEMLEQFTGAKAEITDFHDAGKTSTADPAKPTIQFDDFKGLHLQTGVLKNIEPLPGLPGLSAVQLDCCEALTALVPTSVLKGITVGEQAVAATKLHPVKVGDGSFDCTLLSVCTDTDADLMTVQPEFAPGTPLR